MTSYRIPEGVLRAELKGEEVLLNPDTGMYHLVNATGGRLLELFGSGRSFEDAVELLAGEHRVDAAQVRVDAQRFVDAMLSRRLLEHSDMGA